MNGILGLSFSLTKSEIFSLGVMESWWCDVYTCHWMLFLLVGPISQAGATAL